MKISEEIHNCCPFCGGQGFTVRMVPVMVGVGSDGEPIEGAEPEQEQCQFCYVVAYPLAERAAKLETDLEILQDRFRNGIKYDEEQNQYILVWTKKEIEDAEKRAEELCKFFELKVDGADNDS